MSPSRTIVNAGVVPQARRDAAAHLIVPRDSSATDLISRKGII